MFVSPSLNVVPVEAPPFPNLKQNTQYPHGITQIIGVSISRNGYLGICTIWWNNNNDLKVNSRTKLKIMGAKVPRPWITKQISGEIHQEKIMSIATCLMQLENV